MGTIAKWIAAAGALLLAACNPMEELDDADKAITQFHRQLDQRDFDGIWRATHGDFQAGQPREAYDAFMEAVRDKLGEAESSERQGFNINTNNGVTFVTVNMLTRFEEGEANEVFVFRRDGERLKLVNYNVNSQALIVN
jgi:hypothetical protein